MYGLSIFLEGYKRDVNYWYLMIALGPETLLAHSIRGCNFVIDICSSLHSIEMAERLNKFKYL